jgi:DNA-binding LytR/AlgR family response regulator
LRDPITDVRELGEVTPLFAPHGFLRVHREYAVNLRRVALIRPRPSGRDWELKMEPPVNRVIPIARESLEDLWAAFAPT